MINFNDDGTILNKDELISGEMEELKKIYENIKDELKPNVNSMIERVSFLKVSMMELEKKIKLFGYTEEYQNGANQKGIKKSSVAEIYINFSKSYLTYIKHLDELLMKGKKEIDNDELIQFIKRK